MLTVSVQSVNLPDGTQLTVNYGGLGVDLGLRWEPGARGCRPEESVSTHNR